MIVVTGATGNVGRPLVEALAAAGEQVTALARNPAAGPAPGVRTVAADLAEPDALGPALAGADPDAVFLLVAGDVLAGRGDPDAVVGAVLAAGARRIVLLSSQAAGTRPGAPGHARLRAFEDALRRSPAPQWTILRPGGYYTNTFAWAAPIRAHRAAAAPFAHVALPFVDPADIAHAAAAVLCAPDAGHAGRVYELTGPEALTPRERAAAIGRAIGAEVRFTEQSAEQAREQMLGFMPAPVADSTLAILGSPLPEETRVSPDAQQLLGHPPSAFADWAARNAPAFA